MAPVHKHRRHRRSKHKARQKIKRALLWVVLPLVSSALLIKTLQFYFGAP
jgi:hypothetical protein